MEIAVTLPLKKEAEKDGIVILKNEETKLRYFALLGDEETIISCPDNSSAFDKIEVHPHVVVCQLPWMRDENGMMDTMELRKQFRVYQRAQKKWLINPKIQEDLDKPADSEETSPLNFGKVITLTPEYIHIHCDNSGEEDRVYVFKTKHWVEVPDWDLEMFTPIKHFISVRIGKFQKKPCLYLQGDNGKNPFSVYFLDSGEYFSVLNPLKQKGSENRCAVFYRIFSSYVIIGIGNGFSRSPDYFYLWRIQKQDFFAPKRVNREADLVEDAKFKHNYFTEEHIGVLANNDKFEIISTKTWEPVSVEFSYRVSACWVENLKVGDNGKMIAYVDGPERIETKL